jgi:hypothetical protein
LLIVFAIWLAAQGSAAPTADGAASAKVAVPPSAVTVSIPRSRWRNAALLPVRLPARDVIDNSLRFANFDTPRKPPPNILPSNSAPPPIQTTTDLRSHRSPFGAASTNIHFVAESLQLSDREAASPHSMLR